MANGEPSTQPEARKESESSSGDGSGGSPTLSKVMTVGDEQDIAELRARGSEFAIAHGLLEPADVRAFSAGAVLASLPSTTASPKSKDGGRRGSEKTLAPAAAPPLDEVYEMLRLSGLDIDRLEQERRGNCGLSFRDKWTQPMVLYLVVILCSVCAAVQGMDETVINGAQMFYQAQFGIVEKESERNTWLVGLVNSAPYICCALIGCWLTRPMNRVLGRKGTIWVTCSISAVACIWQAFAHTWWHMLIARFILGFGIGPKSATVPIYASECSPPAIRGGLGTQWQMWTAFGIMLGLVADVALYRVPDMSGIVGLNWRLMMGSAALPAILVVFVIYKCPESPRWYLDKRGKDGKPRVREAYEAMCRLRFVNVQAARDIYHMSRLIEADRQKQQEGTGRKNGGWGVLVHEPRTRRAMVASQIVMIMQQLCGINIIAYYSSTIFTDSGFTEYNALLASLGFGCVNFLFAIPATLTIDTFGRRNLLLFSLPFLGLCMFWAGFSFYIPMTEDSSKARLGSIATAIYLFCVFYSPGAGPVPFTFSAEAYPLHARASGMSLATATTWGFNGALAITWPSIHRGLGSVGAFCLYGSFNLVLWFFVLLFVPETKGRTLEELDEVFNVPTRMRVAWGLRQVKWAVQKYLFRRSVADLVPVEQLWAEERARNGSGGDREQ